MAFGDETDFNPTRANFDVQANADADIADTAHMTTIPCAKETTSELKNSSPQASSMLVKNVTSIQNPPDNQQNPSSFTDTPLVNKVKHGKKSEDEGMPPLVDITDDITG